MAAKRDKEAPLAIKSSPVWHPFTQMKNSGSFPQVSSAKGAKLFLDDGGVLIDGISSWWVITHGHCEPAITAAIQAQAARLDQVIFAGFTHENAEGLAESLVAMTPAKLTRVFYSDDGSTAVEVALKMAIQSWRQRGRPERNLFLAFEHAYHGDTVGAMSVGGPSVFSEAFEGLMFRVIRAEHPTHSSEPAAAFVADFKDKLATHADRLAGVIIEPLIQGAGGMIVWPEEAVRDIARACRDAGVYLIFDEIMTGFGRTGATFAMDKLGIAPDLACLSKGLTGGFLPLSVTMATEEIYESFLSDDRAKTFFHGHSFTANPVACAAACANVQLLRERDMHAQWRRIENLHRERLRDFERREDVADTRVCGPVAAVEVKSRKSDYLSPIGPDMYRLALSRGVLLRPLGNVLYLLPPYCIEDDDLHRCWDVIGACVDLAAARP